MWNFSCLNFLMLSCPSTQLLLWGKVCWHLLTQSLQSSHLKQSTRNEKVTQRKPTNQSQPIPIPIQSKPNHFTLDQTPTCWLWQLKAEVQLLDAMSKSQIIPFRESCRHGPGVWRSASWFCRLGWYFWRGSFKKMLKKEVRRQRGWFNGETLWQIVGVVACDWPTSSFSWISQVTSSWPQRHLQGFTPIKITWIDTFSRKEVWCLRRNCHIIESMLFLFLLVQPSTHVPPSVRGRQRHAECVPDGNGAPRTCVEWEGQEDAQE